MLFKNLKFPYTNPRSLDDCLKLMLADIEKHRSFVLSAVTGELGEKIPLMYDLAVYIMVSAEIRIKRIEQRECERYGDRICEGGDMYEQHRKFVDFAASRSLVPIERYAETLSCPVICVDGIADLRENAANTAKLFCEITGFIKQ